MWELVEPGFWRKLYGPRLDVEIWGLVREHDGPFGKQFWWLVVLINEHGVHLASDMQFTVGEILAKRACWRIAVQLSHWTRVT